MSPRRQLAYAVVVCLVGAGLALYAANRTWTVQVTVRPAPLPELRVARTGGSLLPWLPPLAVVGLAGAGALVAARGAGRRMVGGLLFLAGLGLVALSGYGLVAVVGVRTAWPLLSAFGGLLVTAGGGYAAVRGRGWPTMGARYERRARAAADRPERAPDPNRAAWDALDRGEDPTDG